MNLRTLLFWGHLAAGVTTGGVILLMSTTGVLLTYERQLIEWSDRGYRSDPPDLGAAPLSIEELLTLAREQRPGQIPTAITRRSDPGAPAVVSFGQTTVYQDVHTGQVLGAPSTDVRRVMSRLRAWHRWLALDGEKRAVGKAISGWSSVAFLFIVVSGPFLWWPPTWRWANVRAVLLFRKGLRGKARDFNWHNVIGIWSAVPLAVIVATALPISFTWANDLVYQVVGETPPQRNRTPRSDGSERQPADFYTDGLDALWARAEAQVPGWRSINLRLADAPGAPAVFAIDSGNGRQPQRRGTLTLDTRSGSIVNWEPFESQSLGRRLRSWTRFTHTGEYYGVAGQTLAGLASLGAVILVATGIALSVRRFVGRFSRRASARQPPRSKAA